MIAFKTIKTEFTDTWADYRKTASFRSGGRWNHPQYPVLYLSTNPQNAMVEIANYTSSPKMANRYYQLVAFDIKSPRLKTLEPKLLPDNWFAREHRPATMDIGSKILDDPNYDGFLVPSANINHVVATHAVNEIRTTSYANMVINIETLGVDNIKMYSTFSPIFSSGMFSAIL